MKRYIFGVIAIAIAVFSFAFTTAPKKARTTDVLFYYNGPDYSKLNVEDPSNWVMGESPSTCGDADRRACEITVDPSDVLPNNTLKSTVTITSAQYLSTADHFVVGGSPTSINNKDAN